MPTIKSDITGNRNLNANYREIDVPDESEGVYNPAPPEMDLDAINAHLASRGLPRVDAEMLNKRSNQQNFVQQPQTESMQDIEAKIKEARRQKVTGKERLSDAAKKRIEMLCGLTKNIRTFDLDGNSYTVRTLKGREMRDALVAASEFDGTVHLPFETRKQLLSRSLVQVAGADVELFLGDDSLEARMEFVELMEEEMLNKMYGQYVALVNEVREKYEIKTDADVQGVVADLKK